MKIDAINRKLDRLILIGLALVWAILAIQINLSLCALDVQAPIELSTTGTK